MHTATKGSKVDISSEKKLEEFANNLSPRLKQGDIFFYTEKWELEKQLLLNF